MRGLRNAEVGLLAAGLGVDGVITPEVLPDDFELPEGILDVNDPRRFGVEQLCLPPDPNSPEGVLESVKLKLAEV